MTSPQSAHNRADVDALVGTPAAAVRAEAVSLRKGGPPILEPLDWCVAVGERWVVLGPNGSGKTSLLRLAGGHDHPTAGTLHVLGALVGRVDLRVLRRRIGFVSGALTRTLRPAITAGEAVLCGRYAALEVWWNDYTDDDRARAIELLGATGVDGDKPFGVLSEGERQQVLLSRVLMGDPELLLLDEPFAGLDLGARERLLTRLETLADAATPAVLVTHHVEEIPTTSTHVLLLRDAKVMAQGPVDDVLTADALSSTFGLRLHLGRDAGRWWSRAT